MTFFSFRYITIYDTLTLICKLYELINIKYNKNYELFLAKFIFYKNLVQQQP